MARWFDGRAAPYHQAGIPLLEALFLPLAGAPAFGSLAGTVGAAPPAPRPAEIRRRVARAFGAGSFEGAAVALAGELAALHGAPQVDCLVRHLLESAQRLARLAPLHVAMAAERRLSSPAPLLARLFRLHLQGLGPAAALDRRARPLQLRGIPILAQDLPPIPIPPAAP